MPLRTVPSLVMSAFLVFTASCAADGGASNEASGLYEVSATVLQAREGEPMLCLGGVLTSLPPQCGTFPISNWNWEEVEGEESVSGTTWGEFHLVGRLQEEIFTLAEPPGPARYPEPEPKGRFNPPCPEPKGGWQPLDASQATEDSNRDAVRMAKSHADFAGIWVHNLPQNLVLNIAFTDDISERETEIREVWGGALCVIQAERKYSRLRDIQEQLTKSVLEELDLIMLSVGVDEVANQVTAEVAVADEDDQAALDERYGPGAVRLESVMTPVPAQR